MEKDERFKHLASDPKFRRMPQKERKVKIDKRFQSMFQDPKFKVKSLVDKRGRPQTISSTENFKKYYELTSSEDEESDEEEEDSTLKAKQVKSVAKEKKSIKSKLPEKSKDDEASQSDEESDQEQSEAEEEDDKVLEIDQNEKKSVSNVVRQKLKDLSVDYARGGGKIFSDSSSSDEESSEDEDGSEEIEHAWGELDKDAERTDEATSRLAVCNMDWNRVRSDDLMVLLNSFIPAGGTIKKVSVYQSEFGKQCMKDEDISGPKELAEQTQEETGEDNFDVEKLRVYEMKRLRYYYAVVDCDSAETASHIYDECDGLEFESSSAKIDLRYIPDDLTFDEDPRDTCCALPEAGKYVPQHFATNALAQSKFELTWDETDPRRMGLNKRLWASKDKNLDETDLQQYLASSSGEDSDDGEKKNADVYKSLLQNNDKEDTNKEMEITWGVDLQSKVDEKTNEKLRKEAGLGELTPFEQMMQKKKDKKKQKKLAKMAKAKDSDSEEVEDAPFSDDDLPSDAEDIKQQLMMENNSKQAKGKKKNKKGKKFENDSVVDEKAKAELELLTMDEDNERHFNFNKRLPKKAHTDDDFQIDVKDPRFGALYSSHHFNIDPSDPHYKDNKATQALVAEKLRMRDSKDQVPIEGEPKIQKKASANTELSRLVKSVKRKAEDNKLNKVKSKKMSK